VKNLGWVLILHDKYEEGRTGPKNDERLRKPGAVPRNRTWCMGSEAICTVSCHFNDTPATTTECCRPGRWLYRLQLSGDRWVRRDSLKMHKEKNAGVVRCVSGKVGEVELRYWCLVKITIVDKIEQLAFILRHVCYKPRTTPVRRTCHWKDRNNLPSPSQQLMVVSCTILSTKWLRYSTPTSRYYTSLIGNQNSAVELEVWRHKHLLYELLTCVRFKPHLLA